jgi:hypothetical protein
MKRREIPLIKQIERATQGPIADAHLNILLELEVIVLKQFLVFGVATDISLWASPLNAAT